MSAFWWLLLAVFAAVDVKGVRRVPPGAASFGGNRPVQGRPV